MSHAGGSLPIRLSESYMCSSMAAAVPPFLAWLDTLKDSKPQQVPSDNVKKEFTADVVQTETVESRA